MLRTGCCRRWPGQHGDGYLRATLFDLLWCSCAKPGTYHRRSTLGRRAFSVVGLMAWNALPDDLRDPSLSADNFRKTLKTHLCQTKCTWTFSTLEALRNALYKFKTYLLTTCILHDWSDNSLVEVHKVRSSLETPARFNFFENQSRLVAFDVIAAIWSSHFNLELTVTPKNLYSDTCWTGLAAISSGVGDSLLIDPRTVCFFAVNIHPIKLRPLNQSIHCELHFWHSIFQNCLRYCRVVKIFVCKPPQSLIVNEDD